MATRNPLLAYIVGLFRIQAEVSPLRKCCIVVLLHELQWVVGTLKETFFMIRLLENMKCHGLTNLIIFVITQPLSGV